MVIVNLYKLNSWRLYKHCLCHHHHWQLVVIPGLGLWFQKGGSHVVCTVTNPY